MLIVALTGGIASGKSTATNFFANLGVPIIDMDIIAREVVTPNSKGLSTLVNEFGPIILNQDNQLDRKALRSIIFNDDTKRKTVESILHPLIRQEAENVSSQLHAQGTRYCIQVIPLLYELGWAKQYEHIIVVRSDKNEREQRIIERDSSTLEQAQKIIQTQATDAQHDSIATEIIINNGNTDDLCSKVLSLHKQYQTLSGLVQ